MAKVHITIPVSEEQREMLVQLAAEQGVSLSAFCRNRIMERENMIDGFATLQRTLISTIHDASRQQMRSESEGSSSEMKAMILEVLLLLRSMVPPQKVVAVGGELRRHGLSPFQG